MGPRLLTVSDGVWCVRRASYLVCSYLVRAKDGFVAVDAGMDSEGGDMLMALRSLGATPTELRAILLTHWHNDHAAGAAALAALSSAPVFYHAADEPYLTAETASAGLRRWLAEVVPEMGLLVLLKGLLGNAIPRPVAAARHVVDGERVASDFRVIETPGHTRGHCAYFHEPTGTLFSGDSLAVVGDSLRLMARPVTPDLEAARASVLRCLREQPRALCPGHRKPLTDGLGAAWDRMRARMAREDRWPLLG